MAKYYPVNLNIEGKKCVVLGGGKVAQRKARRLLGCGAVVRLISPRITRGLPGNVELIKRRANLKDLKGAFLVICASDDRAMNAGVSRYCKAKNILVNVVDSPKECNFILPSLISRGDLTITISTAGVSPALSKKIRKDLQKMFGPEYARLLRVMKKLRPEAIKKIKSQRLRKIFFNKQLKQYLKK